MVSAVQSSIRLNSEKWLLEMVIRGSSDIKMFSSEKLKIKATCLRIDISPQ